MCLIFVCASTIIGTRKKVKRCSCRQQGVKMDGNASINIFNKEEELEGSRPYLCIDLKSYYASVECIARGPSGFTCTEGHWCAGET